MQKFSSLLALLLCLTGAALADTIYLKDGREVTGTFTGFENDQFAITDIDGNPLRFRTNRVERVVIDRTTRRRDRDESGISRRGGWDNYEGLDVRPENGWTRSPVQVSRGQRLRVEASGTVVLDGRTNVAAGGLSGQRSRNAPMPNQNAGALIARIGQGLNAPPIFVGQSGEFVADRDGDLYFAVNYPQSGNSRGVFLVNVSLDRGSSGDDLSGRWTRTAQREKTITVNASQAWTDTGIDLEPNMAVEIVAEGQIVYDTRARANSGPIGNRRLDLATYPVQNVGVGAVIAKIRFRDGRESTPIYIGTRNEATTRQNEYGRLFIGVNDDNFGDNSGSYRVTVRNVSMDRGASNRPAARATAGGEKTMTVYGNQAWTDTGIDLEPDMTVEIVAEGQIAYSSSGSAGPEGGRNLGINNYPVRNAGVGAVIAKVRYRDGRESNPVFIGTSNQVSTAQDEYGRLYIGVNDDNFGDNKGSYRVTIRWR